MNPPNKGRLGMIVLVVAFLVWGGVSRWWRTRNLTPINESIILESAKSNGVEFTTNLRVSYYLLFDADYFYGTDVDRCPFSAWRDIHWSLYRLPLEQGKARVLWASNNPNTASPGDLFRGFDGPASRYRLEWNVPPGAECLNAFHPRLTVAADSEFYEDAVWLTQFMSILFAGAGVTLVLRGVGFWLGEFVGKGRSLRILPELNLRSVLPARARRPMTLLVGFQVFAPVWISLLMILVFMFMLFEVPLTPRGILVHLEKPGVAPVRNSPWPESLGIYVGEDGFRLNGRLVARQELQSRLKEQLAKRMVWTVYLEACDRVRFDSVVFAIDVIQKSGAKVIWITPKIREELDRQP